jgi:hypothetical protein
MLSQLNHPNSTHIYIFLYIYEVDGKEITSIGIVMLINVISENIMHIKIEISNNNAHFLL